MQYDPLMDSPEARAFNDALDEERPITAEVSRWLDEQLAQGITHGHLPEDLRLRAKAASDKTRAAYDAYMKVIGED